MKILNMNKQECPKLEKCPIFQKNVLHNELVGQTYRNLFCITKESNFNSCKRHLFSEKYGVSAEVIDARTLVPFNYEPVLESVKKTGKLLLASDASSRGSFLKEMAQTITELAFDYLDAPPVVVGSRNWIIPAFEMEQFFFPQTEWLLDAIHEKIIPLKEHKPGNDYSPEKSLRLNREGV